MLRCQEQQRRAVTTKASISAFTTGQLASPSLANAPSEDFADHSSDVVTSSLNYLQRAESLISGPACDAPLWFLGIASIRIALRGFLDLALVSNRPFPHLCFLVFTPTACERVIQAKAAENWPASFPLQESSLTATAPSHMLSACSQLFAPIMPGSAATGSARTSGEPGPRTGKVHPTYRDRTNPAFP